MVTTDRSARSTCIALILSALRLHGGLHGKLPSLPMAPNYAALSHLLALRIDATAVHRLR